MGRTIATVCMVKNEEQVIDRMIKSASQVSDLFIFTDTGSEDNTKQKIKETCDELGVKYEIHQTQMKDFGTTRTETIQNAKNKADYLLLLDADMTITVDENFDKESLDKDAYHVYYSGGTYYARLLFVSGSFDWKYYGVTHEYIHCPDIKSIGRLEGLWINHHSDGGCRSDKFERDIRLLTEALEKEPDNRRYWFYLAQTYKDLGKHKEALDAYQRRIDLGGWKEEVYYSMYQKARMLYRLGHNDSARLCFIDAFEFKPNRLESLYGFAFLCREEKRWHQSVALLEVALKKPFPKDDLLFVEKPVYDFLLRFEYSIALYYVNRIEEAIEQCDILLNNKNLPEDFYRQTVENKKIVTDYKKREDARKVENPSYNEKVLYVSGFTEGTEYEDEIVKLRDSFEKFGVDYVIYRMPNRGSWVRNTQEKLQWMFKALSDYKCPIVWVDADAELLKKDDYFHRVTDDIQTYYIKQWDDYLIGTLFLNYNQRVLDALGQWIFNCEINDVSAQKVFRYLIKKKKLPNVTLGYYPVEYCKIFDNHLMECDDPVIVHYQASRRFKNKIERVDTVKDIINGKAKSYDTCSVIGNGQFTDDLSDSIDSSFVLRCNNFQLGDEYKGIGSKTDVNISSLYRPIIPSGKVDHPILGIHPISHITNRYSNAKDMYHFWNESKHMLSSHSNEVYAFDEGDLFFDEWRKVADSIGAFPTVGIVAIALARYLGFKKIIVSGFDFFSSERTHYFKNEFIKPGSHHAPNYEAKLLKTWMEYDDIEYVLDMHTQESLKDITPLRFKHILATRFNLGLYDNDRKDVSGNSVKDQASKWMNDRLKRFRDYTIPSVCKQNHTNLDWVIFFDPKTPQSFRKRIESLRKHFNFIPIYKSIDDNSDNSIGVYKLLQEYIYEHYSPAYYDVMITTRLDNDGGYIGDVFSGVIDALPVNFERQKPLGLNLKRGVITDGTEYYDMNYPDRNFVSVYEDFSDGNVQTVYYTQHGTNYIHNEVDIRYLDRHSFVIYCHENNLQNQISEAKRFGQIVRKMSKSGFDELYG